MAQRLLSRFDAFDKYSQDILSKHAKKCHLSYMERVRTLSAPLSFDFELDTHQDSEGQRSEAPRGSTTRKFASTECVQSATRPMTAHSARSIPGDSGSADGIKSRCVSAKRRPWRSEVQCVPNLEALCQQESIPAAQPVLGIPYGHPWSSSRDPGEENPRGPPVQDDGDNGTLPAGSPPREKTREVTQRVAPVSLCIEDEMKKDDVKIITVKQKTHERAAAETQSTTYNNPNKFVVYNTLSGVQKKTVRSDRYGGTRVHTGKSGNSAKYIINNTNQPTLQKAAVRSRAGRVLLPDSGKVIIQFLSADGSKHKADIARDGKPPPEEHGKSPGIRKSYFQEMKTTLKPISARGAKDGSGHVGPVINGINPKKGAGNDRSAQSRSSCASRSFSPSRATAKSPKLSSERETRKWNYISICKPLSPPDYQPSAAHSSNTVSDRADPAMDTARPASGTAGDKSFAPLKASSMVLEYRRGVQGGVQGDRSAPGSDMKEYGEHAEPTSVQGSSFPAPAIDTSNASAPVNEDQCTSSSSFPANISTIPVISIPTAPVDISE